MALPNGFVNPILTTLKSNIKDKCFDLSGGKLCVKGVQLFSEVPSNVSYKSFLPMCRYSDAPIGLFQHVQSISFKGGFLGFHKEKPSCRLMNSLGKFNDIAFLSIFRFKEWWSTQWVGSSGSDLQMETQWLLLDLPEIRSYVIILPIIEGKFRSALYPGMGGHLMICAESGSTQVKASSFDAIAYIHVSENPYNLMKEAYRALRVYLSTFRLLEEKSIPPIVDKFGWCTWDAFYLSVEPAGIWHGLNEYSNGGVSPRFLIIDDGWQSVSLDGENPHADAQHLVLGGTRLSTARLHRLDESEKFRMYTGGSLLGPNSLLFNPRKPKMLILKAFELDCAEKARGMAIKSGVTDLSKNELQIKKFKQELDEMFDVEQECASGQICRSSSPEDEHYGMKAFVNDLRTKFKGLDDIYVWQALCGTWGGVRPGTTQFNSKIISCEFSSGLQGTMYDGASANIIEGGIGLVHPDQVDDFYDSMHSYLSRVGITGVKVDVIHTLEHLGEEYGGRVDLAKAYYKGLSQSLSKNFRGTGLISSMQQCNDFFFLGTRQISMGRVGDDFWFQDPYGDPSGVYWLQGVHVIHCAYNSMWMGQIIQPDWDMFQSDHPCAKFHASSRAICGGPVYVSDCLGGHNFDLLKKLVFADGTIPKCQYFALPTRDCLFKNALFDGQTILKIWNLNKYGGVVGAFNCQGAGWDPKEQRFKAFPQCYRLISGSVHVSDVEWDQKKGGTQMGEADEYAVYLNQAEKLSLATPYSDAIKITIQPSLFELFSFVPIKKLVQAIKFAPIGLTNMFNSGGTIQGLEYKESSVKIEVKGDGNFLAYSSVPPKKCTLNGGDAGFQWLADGELALNLPWVEEAGGVSDLDFIF